MSNSKKIYSRNGFNFNVHSGCKHTIEQPATLWPTIERIPKKSINIEKGRSFFTVMRNQFTFVDATTIQIFIFGNCKRIPKRNEWIEKHIITPLTYLGVRVKKIHVQTEMNQFNNAPCKIFLDPQTPFTKELVEDLKKFEARIEVERKKSFDDHFDYVMNKK